MPGAGQHLAHHLRAWVERRSYYRHVLRSVASFPLNWRSARNTVPELSVYRARIALFGSGVRSGVVMWVEGAESDAFGGFVEGHGVGEEVFVESAGVSGGDVDCLVST